MAVPSTETIKWLALLLAAVLLTSFGTTFPNRLNQLRSPRAHNGVRLFNECLARSQLALFNYFLALAITGELPRHPNAKILLLPAAVAAAYFYVANIASSVELGRRLFDLHECPGSPVMLVKGESTTATFKECEHPIGTWEFLRISSRYIFSTAFLIGLGVYFAIIAGS
jgi:hypothetical protein